MALPRRSALRLLGGTAAVGLLPTQVGSQSTQETGTPWPMNGYDAGATNAAPERGVDGFQGISGLHQIIAENTIFYREDGSPSRIVAEGDVNWRTDHAVLGAPAYHDGLVFAVVPGTEPMRFVAHDVDDGSVCWERPLVDPSGGGGPDPGSGDRFSESPLRVAGSRVYGVSEGWLYCVDTETRHVQWMVEGSFGDVVVESGTVVTTGPNLQAFDAETGDRRWTTEEGSGWHLAACGDYVVRSSSNDIEVFDIRDGTLQWDVSLSDEYRAEFGSMYYFPHAFSDPAVTPKAVYVGVESRYEDPPGPWLLDAGLRAYSLETGELLSDVQSPVSADRIVQEPPDFDIDPESNFFHGKKWSNPVVIGDELYVGFYELYSQSDRASSLAVILKFSLGPNGELLEGTRFADGYTSDNLIAGESTLYG